MEPPSNRRETSENNALGILQSTTTVAGVALGLLAFLQEVQPAIIISYFVFLSGSVSLYAAILSLIHLNKIHGYSRWELFRPKSLLSVTFWAIIFLSIAYPLIVFPDIGLGISMLLDTIAGAFRSPPQLSE
jgi:hypothetical protein